MITERQFASSFPDFWQELLPLLTPSCVHLLNVGYEKSLQDEHVVKIDPVETNEETRDSAVISEFAYHLAKEAFQRTLSINDAFNDDTIRGAAEELAFNLINKYEGRSVHPGLNLNDAELDEGLELANRYKALAHLYGGPGKCLFQVPIKGCGFIHACHADLVIDEDILVEVKTVKRTLSGKDIRQLVVYLALSSATNPYLWKHVIFFNPRRSVFHSFRVSELIELMSGGKSVVDVYQELLDFTCSSDVQLDSTF